MPWISAATKSLDYSDKLLYNTNSNANNSLETAVLWSPWLRMLFFISGEWEVGKELSCSYLYHLYCGLSDGNYCQAWLILDSPAIIKKAFKSFVILWLSCGHPVVILVSSWPLSSFYQLSFGLGLDNKSLLYHLIPIKLCLNVKWLMIMSSSKAVKGLQLKES